ncbi:MAG: hypothetical protein QNL62_16900 [Gammaproteobacteria bacterium]|nr:hypothetical protein [Gammaproteobacteria bacterium]
MKNILTKKNKFLKYMLFVAIIALVGCTSDSDDESSTDHDVVTVTMLDEMTVNIHWDKNYVGYSAVLSRESGDTSFTGLVMTSNTTGSYELTCSVVSITTRVSFDCINTGDGYLPDFDLTTMTIDTEYDIQASEGIDHDDQPVAATLFFNSTTQNLELR